VNGVNYITSYVSGDICADTLLCCMQFKWLIQTSLPTVFDKLLVMLLVLDKELHHLLGFSTVMVPIDHCISCMLQICNKSIMGRVG
jgi:hypothetical protein